MRKYDTVLFDLDGTLLNTLDDLADSVNHILTANGCPLRSREEVRSFLGTGSRRLMAQALPQGENTPDFEQLLEEYKEWYNTHCMVRTDFYPGGSFPAEGEVFPRSAGHGPDGGDPPQARAGYGGSRPAKAGPHQRGGRLCG